MIDVDPATQALAERALQFGAAQLGIRRLHPKLVWHEPWADGRWGEFPRERPDTVLISTNVPVEHLPGVIFHELGHLQEYAKGYVICEASAESVERRLVAEWRDHEAAAARAEQEAAAAEAAWKAVPRYFTGVPMPLEPSHDWRTRESEQPMRAIRGLTRSET